MEGAGRERRGGRDLYNCRVRTQAAATPTQLEHYKHFSPRTWAEDPGEEKNCSRRRDAEVEDVR